MGAITCDTKSDGSFSVRISPCRRPVKSWREELQAAAREIAARAQKPLMLFFSGGLDSEIMCRSFFDQGITFTAATFEHAENANRRDVDHARKWCWDRGIPHEIVPFDTAAFLRSGIEAFTSRGYTSGSVMRYFQLALLSHAEERKAFGVIGDGSMLLRGEIGRAEPYIRLGSGEGELHRWAIEDDSRHEPFFFRSIPEVWVAYLQIPIVVYAISNPSMFYNGQSKHTFKRFVHQAMWPEASARSYYTPFGTFRAARMQKEAELLKRFEGKIATYDLNFSDLSRALTSRVGTTAV